MTAIPTLTTARLTLRPFADADAVQALLSSPEIAATTLLIPHPYSDGAASAWISTHGDAAERGAALHWAIARADDQTLLGAVTLRITPDHRRGEIGYWLGVPFWNRGYATEAARRVIGHASAALGLIRVEGTCLPANPASARVMKNAGMKQEGALHGYVRKNGRFEDVDVFAIVSTDRVDQVF
ncbi:MAG: GNAT family N-acetyltransferase [Thermomicrobiales bacterium]